MRVSFLALPDFYSGSLKVVKSRKSLKVVKSRNSVHKDEWKAFRTSQNKAQAELGFSDVLAGVNRARL